MAWSEGLRVARPAALDNAGANALLEGNLRSQVGPKEALLEVRPIGQPLEANQPAGVVRKVHAVVAAGERQDHVPALGEGVQVLLDVVLARARTTR